MVEELQNTSELRLSSSVVTVGKDNTVPVLAINMNEHVKTLTKDKAMASFQLLSPQDGEDLIEVGPDFLALGKMKNGQILSEKNQFLQLSNMEKKSSRRPPDCD